MTSSTRRVTTEPESDTKGANWLLLLAAPFALGGFAVALWASADVLTWIGMRSWVPVPMIIESTRLDVQRGDDGETYRAIARYRYQFEGRDYQGERVAVSGGSDNVGRFQRDANAELRRHQRSRKAFTGFVNPDAPDESVLYRQLRIELFGIKALFALLFGGVGIGLMVLLAKGKRLARREAALSRAHPDAPWLWRDDWASGTLRGTGRVSMWATFGFAALWNLISAPIPFVVMREYRDGNTVALVGLLFSIVGIGLAVAAWRAWRRHRTYGTTTLELESLPVALGRTLRATLVCEQPIDATGPFHITLECVRRETSGSGRNRRTSEAVLWQRTLDVAAGEGRRRDGHYRLPLAVRLPPDQPKSAVDGNINWQLKITAPTRGVDFENQFELPVFGVEGSAEATATEERAALEAFDVESALLDEGLELQPPDTLSQPRMTKRGPAFSTGLFTVIWLGVVWLIVHLDGIGFFAVIFGLFAIPLLLFTLDLTLSWRRLVVRDGEVRCFGGWFGAGKPKVLRNEFVRRYEIRRGMQVGTTLYHDVIAHRVDGGKTTLLKMIRDRRVAEHLVAWLQGEAALPG